MQETPWYEQWPMKLQKEQYEIERQFPSLKFGIFDGYAVWAGPFIPAKKEEDMILLLFAQMTILAHRLVFIQRNIAPSVESPHVMPDGSLCLAYPRFDSANATVADVAMSAWLWVVHFEHFIETGSWDWIRDKNV